MVSLTNVSVLYEKHHVLENVNLTVHPGDFVFLVGRTGAGKSSLLKLLYMDVLPASGTVTIGEYSSDKIQWRDIPHIRRTIGIIFQDMKLLEDRNVYDNIAFVLHVTGAKRKAIKPRVLRALADVGLSHKRASMPHELSGGEQQRVGIARALVNEPWLLVADEPTGNLDPSTSNDILDLLIKINNRGTAILMATHNYDIVRRTPAARIMQIRDRQVVEVEMRKK
jgi:cell division transport system ATP-binding protein